MEQRGSGGMRRGSYMFWVATIAAIVVAQSVVYLVLTLHLHRYHTEFDLDLSNGIPDLVSTAVLALATVGAAALAWYEDGIHRVLPTIATFTLAALTLADLVHDGAHPTERHGTTVVLIAASTVAIAILIGLTAPIRVRMTLALGIVLLGSSFFVSQFHDFDRSFGRRGDATREYRTVVKEGFEVGGWALLGLALWDLALLRRASYVRLTAPASPAPVASRQRAA